MEEIGDKFYLLENLVRDTKDWIRVADEDNVITEKKQLDLDNVNIACFRSYGYVNADYRQIRDDIWNKYDSVEIRKFDTDIIHHSILADLQRDPINGIYPRDVASSEIKYTQLCHQINKLAWPLWDRETVYLKCRKTTNSAAWIYSFSVESDAVPRKSDETVRAIINISGYVFIKDGNGTKFYRVAHIDPCGWVPNAMIDHYANKNVRIIQELQRIYGTDKN